ncbi:MAG: hypothetical protein AAFP02_23025, partial [Bacteroidota bacterium]
RSPALAQFSTKGRLQLDVRGSYELTGLRYAGLGIEYVLVKSPKWETGLRLGGIASPIDDRISTGENHYWFVSSDLLVYRRLFSRAQLFLGAGGSYGTRAYYWGVRNSNPYIYDDTIFLYLILGARVDLTKRIFVQSQIKGPPLRWPHDEVMGYSLIECSLGLRLGRK